MPMPVSPDKLDALEADADYQDIKERFLGASPAQLKTYVQNNVIDLASAKTLLVKVLLYIQRIP
jgi:hypothetical protein